jgi:hypothetical protein
MQEVPTISPGIGTVPMTEATLSANKVLGKINLIVREK